MDFLRLLGTAVFLKIMLGACGGSGSGTSPSTTTTTVSTTTAPTTTPTLTPSARYGDYRAFPQEVRFLNERPVQHLVHDAEFPTLTAWGQAVTLSYYQPTAQEATVEISYMRILRRNVATGNVDPTPVAQMDYSEQRAGEHLRCDLYERPAGSGRVGMETCYGALYNRWCPHLPNPIDCWFRDSDRIGGIAEMENSDYRNGLLRIFVAQRPMRVAHWWTVTRIPDHYRAPTEPGFEYFVEARFRVRGMAAIQFGMDRWRSPPADCADPRYAPDEDDQPGCNNKQSWYSIWVGDTTAAPDDGFVTGRFPLQFAH